MNIDLKILKKHRNELNAILDKENSTKSEKKALVGMVGLADYVIDRIMDEKPVKFNRTDV